MRWGVFGLFSGSKLFKKEMVKAVRTQEEVYVSSKFESLCLPRFRRTWSHPTTSLVLKLHDVEDYDRNREHLARHASQH